MKSKDQIIYDNNILSGKPTLKGTRLSVEFIKGRLKNGWTEQQLLENYPRLTEEHLKAISQIKKKPTS